jgi:hypothetical protein
MYDMRSDARMPIPDADAHPTPKAVPFGAACDDGSLPLDFPPILVVRCFPENCIGVIGVPLLKENGTANYFLIKNIKE